MIEFLFFVAGFFAAVFGTVSGFGTSTIFLPLSLFFFDFKTSLVLVGFFHLFTNLGKITFFRHSLDKKLLLLFGVPSVLLTILGAFLVGFFSQEILTLSLGVFLLWFSVISLVKPSFKFKTSNLSAVIAGSFSGFSAGLIGTGGAIRGGFLTAYNLNKGTYIATMAGIALAVDISRLPVYFSSGFLAEKYFFFIPILFFVAIVGTYMGKKIVSILPQEIFRKIVLVLLVLASLKFIAAAAQLIVV